MSSVTDVTTRIFDRTRDALLARDVCAGMDSLRASLSTLRSRLAPDEWAAFGEEARSHPVHELLLESPFTRRACLKPRGYAGDAVLIDLIYGTTPAGETVSPLGRLLYDYEFDSASFRSMRSRRATLAREIDDAASQRPGARVLSVSCGHLREIEWSRAVLNGQASVMAFDQDRESLDLIDREYGRYGVCTFPGTLGDMLRRSVCFQDLDLIYVSGLYDYLETDLAAACTGALFRMLALAGSLLIANFTPQTHDAAFMETFMDWRLVYRDEHDMQTLTACIVEQDVDTIEQFRDDLGNITYLRVTRR